MKPIALAVISAIALSSCATQKRVVEQQMPEKDNKTAAFMPYTKAVDWYFSSDRSYLVSKATADLKRRLADLGDRANGGFLVVSEDDILFDQTEFYRTMRSQKFTPDSDDAAFLSMERPVLREGMRELLATCDAMDIQVVLISHKDEDRLNEHLKNLKRLGVNLAESHMHLRIVDGEMQNREMAEELRSPRVVAYAVNSLDDLPFLFDSNKLESNVAEKFVGTYGEKIFLFPNPVK